MKRILWLVVLAFISLHCADSGAFDNPPGQDDPPPADPAFNTIAFGSCNRIDLPQPLWDDIIANNPDLWIWMGDIIYGDSEDMSVLAAKYDALSANSGYKSLLNQCPVIGIWDDHDYGKNNAGKEYGPKDASKALLFDFLGVPDDDPSRARKGAYQSYVLGDSGKKVKFLLLDARYFRDEDEKEDGAYILNTTGTVLGEEQWAWLADELTDPDISLFVLVSGIQILPTQHRYEKWSNFPNERQRLIDLIVEKQPKAAFFLTGDRHIGEISVLDVPGLSYPLVDITSSGLTHAYTGNKVETNDLRHGGLVNHLNFGVMHLDWSQDAPKVRVEVRGDQDTLYQAIDIEF
ncbi:MAG: alkaline phosphatase family protein [Bacteroidetes bacterium]|nr:MAG: alkaline phosphatase family protein [Bacteroidota bacterium]